MRRNSGFVFLYLCTILALSTVISVCFGGGVCLADNWVMTAGDGLAGDYRPVQEEVTSMAVFDSAIYAGTYDEKNGCEIWAQESGSWVKIAGGGFGDKSNVVAKSMLVHDSRLYVGTGKLGLGGCEVWSFDGSGWSQVNDDGFGSTRNATAYAMASYGGALVVGTDNSMTGGQVWRFADGTWTALNANGFGNPDNRTVNSLCEYAGGLFAGTSNFVTGCEVWRYGGSAWSQSVGQGPEGSVPTGGGFGGEASNQGVSAMAVWNGKLYAGLTVSWTSEIWQVANLIAKPWVHKVWSYDGSAWAAVPAGGDNGGYGGPNFGNGTFFDHALTMCAYGAGLAVGTQNAAAGCQVWLWNGSTWQWLNTFGFGDIANQNASSMAVLGGNLFVGTGKPVSGADVWKYDGSDWQLASANGFSFNSNYRAGSMASYDGYLYAGVSSSAGAELWRTGDGSTWSRVASGGFGDPNNLEVTSLVTLGSHLYIGTRNNRDGGEVYRYDGTSTVMVNNSGFHPSTGYTYVTNDTVSSMCAFNGAIWAGTNNRVEWTNLEQGCQIYRYNGTSWIKEQVKGFNDSWNLTATSMCSYNNGLYVGTSNGTTGCEVWRRGPVGWQQVNTDGFGNSLNHTASAMAVLDGYLYVGVSGPSCELWRYNGSSWTKIGDGGFGDLMNAGISSLAPLGNTLYVSTSTTGGSGQVWRYDANGFTRTAAPGFGETTNSSVDSLAAFGSKIFAGTLNEDEGCQIWSSLGPPGNITSVSPVKGSHGQTLDVAITGNGTHFVNGVSQAVFSGAGIVVNSTAVSDPLHATASITVADGAAPGAREVNVITGQDTPYVSAGGSFTVLDPRITSVSPASTAQGRTLDIEITGTDTSFSAGSSVAAFTGDGITVNATTVLSATRARANITVEDYAAPGKSEVNVITAGMVTDPLPGGLTVNPAPPRIDAAVPAYGAVGDTVTLQGKWFGDRRVSSKVRFNGREAASYVSWSENTIECTIPAGATSGPVVVTTDSGSSKGFGFKVVNTKPGTDVNVNAGNGVSVLFKTVTSPGNTLASKASDPVVDDFAPVPGLSRNVTTDAGYGGKAAVTLSYADVGLLGYQEEVLVLLHQEGGAWKDVTTSRDPESKTITAGVSELGHFAIAIPEGTSLPATATWYLAEGSTDWGFDTYLTVQNPNKKDVTARVTYMTEEGQVPRADIRLPAMSQTTLNPAADLGRRDFSTRIECLEAEIIAVDRTMTWTGPGASAPGAHSTIGLPDSAGTWYMPEGSTKWGFETWILVQNPNDRPALCTLTYMVEGVGPVQRKKTVAARSRATFNMADDIGAGDAAIKVDSDLPVICERTMYRNNRREGHNSIATTESETDYYLAEGTTAYGFTTYVCVQNPNDRAADVTLSFMTPAGPAPGPTVRMEANARKTFRVNDILPSSDCSIRVSGTLPIIAERAMYWNNGSGEAMHASIGVPGAHGVFYLPDGQTNIGWETWTTVQNPNPAAVKVEVTYMTPSGKGNIVFTDVVPANSRSTYNMGSKIMNQRAAALVKCVTPGRKIIVERSMYWNNRGSGTCTVGGYSD